MPRKLFALLACALIAIAAGWWLLGPRRHASEHRIAEHPLAAVTPVPSVAPSTLPATSTPAPPTTATPTAAPAATAATSLPAPRPAYHGNAPQLALIVDDCGQWIDTERGFVALDAPLTLSVLPDVHYTAQIAREAAAAGKGVMLHLPMETISGLNPGPGKITTEMTDAQIVAQLQSDLAQVPLARGVNNHEGSKASANARVMRDVIGVLAQRGLFFIDSRTTAASLGEQSARAQGVPTASRDVFLDNQATVTYTEGQLREAAAIARRTGSAIAIGHPRPTTLAAVRAMIPQLEASGIRFVLVQNLVAERNQ